MNTNLTLTLLLILGMGGQGDLPPIERDLTQEYLRFRFANGPAQPEWIEALNREIREPVPVDGKPSGSAYIDRMAKSWGAESLDGLRKWVRENDDMVRALIELPTPRGPQPLPEDYSISDCGVIGPPGPGASMDKMRLLIAAAICAETDSARRSCLAAIRNLILINLKGYEHIEFTTACTIETIQWEFLLSRLHDAPESYARIISSTADTINQSDLVAAVRESERRFIQVVARDPKNGGLVSERLSDTQLRELDKSYLALAETMGRMNSRAELDAFRKGISDTTVQMIIDTMLSSPGLSYSADQVLYLDDLRKTARALAKSGVNAAAKTPTRFFELRRDGDKLIAFRGERTMQIWPLPNGFNGGFSKMRER